VLEATIAAIADVGVDALRMTDISERAGMTPGHILYYFGNKDRILIETLRWSEHDLAERRRSAPVGRRGPRRRLRVLVDDYLPQGTADARWNLWNWKISVVQSPPWRRTSWARAGRPGRSWKSTKKSGRPASRRRASQLTRSSHERSPG
jgi:AcrR family transcriptional regulator